MRDILVTLIIVGLMPACYRRPFVGLCVFSWLAYMRIQDLTWGFAKEFRWSYYVAILMFAGFMASRERRRWFLPDPRTYAMLGLAVIVGVGVLVSGDFTAQQINRYFEFVKIIAIALFTTAIVTNRERLRILVWIIALSLAFQGVKSGIWGIFHLGQVQILRGPGGMLADNNDLSLALSMVVPMLFHLGWSERRPELRRAFLVAVPLTVITIVLTHSRGGFLSIAAAIGVLLWRSRNRLHGMAIGVLLVIAGLVFAPDTYKERLKTLSNPTEEGSAAGRLRAWGIATNMALANPLLGVGLDRFRANFVWYADDPTTEEKQGGTIVAHSSYFQIWAECGTPALILYFGLIFSSFWTCWRVRKEARRRYFSSWLLNYATMFEASMAAFVVGSAFLNRAHFDLFYHWVAIILVFGHIARREMANEDRYPVRHDAHGARGVVRAEVPHGFGPRPRGGGFDRGFQPGRA